MHVSCDIAAAIFDYGGVLAEEGFREGMQAIARENRLDPDAFLDAAADAAWATGYVVGSAQEEQFWAALARKTGLSGDPGAWRRAILSRFTFREWMRPLLADLRAAGLKLAVLSDQTDWLDELEARQRFFAHFDLVVNSFHAGRSKREPEVFTDLAARLGIAPGAALFIDDNPGNVARAESMGLRGHLYASRQGLLAALGERCPGLGGLHA
jgi:putative hydrolase of the HAD superfamily